MHIWEYSIEDCFEGEDAKEVHILDMTLLLLLSSSFLFTWLYDKGDSSGAAKWAHTVKCRYLYPNSLTGEIILGSFFILVKVKVDLEPITEALGMRWEYIPEGNATTGQHAPTHLHTHSYLQAT